MTDKTPLRYRIPRLLVLFGLTWLASASASAADTSPIRSIDVVHDSDTYKATVQMVAPVPQAVAWAVLTDFENMAGWVPNVRESKVLERNQNVVVIEQHGVARFGLASFPYTSVRQLELDPERSIKSTQLKGSMRRLESTMTLVPDSDGTRLVYQMEMVPTGLAAAVVSKDFLTHELSEQFSAIIDEMKHRAR